MGRQALDDGRWFNTGKAEKFEESTFWNGNNHISRATRTQWDHEALYRTKGGRWILHSWSQWQGSRESWSEISNDEAARWLVKNEHEAHSACSAEHAALEVA